MSATNSAGAPLGELRPRGVTPRLGTYLRSVWERREFLVSMAQGNLAAQHMDTVLGNLWHLLNPTLLVLVYYVMFGLVLDTSKGLENFVGFLAVGVFSFGFARKTVSSCATSISGNIGLIRSLQFPRAVLPLSAMVQEIAAYAIALGVLVVVLLLTGEPVKLTWLLAPVVVLWMSMFNLGVGLVMARLADTVRDVSNLIPFVFRILFYASGIIFSVRQFVDSESIRMWFVLNPYFTYIDLLRGTLMTSYAPEHLMLELPVAVLLGPLALLGGLRYFAAGENLYGRG